MVGKRGYDRDRYVRSESDRCGAMSPYIMREEPISKPSPYDRPSRAGGRYSSMNVGIVCSVNGDQSFFFLDLGTYQNAFLEYCAYSSQKKEKNKISIQVWCKKTFASYYTFAPIK